MFFLLEHISLLLHLFSMKTDFFGEREYNLMNGGLVRMGKVKIEAWSDFMLCKWKPADHIKPMEVVKK